MPILPPKFIPEKQSYFNLVEGHKKNSEAALRLNAIIETATDGIISIGENGIIELANLAAHRLFGYDDGELEGKSVNILMPAPHSEKHDSYITKYLRTGEAKIIGIGREVMGKKKDGTLFPIRLSISEVPLDDRRSFTGIVHDLTNQKRVEQALKEEKERAQLYLDIANTIIVAINADETIQMLNRQGHEVLGLQEGQAIGLNWFDIAVPADRREEMRSVFHLLMQGHQIDYYENYILAGTGKQHLIAWRNSIVRKADGSVTTTISSGIDITAQREAEDRIININAELEQRVEARTEELADAINQMLDTNKKLKHEIRERRAAEQAIRANEYKLKIALEKEKELSELKSRFVSMASHEFRTPLSTILSSADLIEAYIKEEQQAKRLRHTTRIKSSVANLTGILNDFLSLSRLEEGKIQPQPTVFDLASFCREVMEEVQSLLKPGQKLHFEGLREGMQLYLDKQMLKNIFFNLLSNSIKYSEAEKPIYCKTFLEESMLKVAFIDQGIGIPEEEQQHLFTRFFRAHNAENIQGTGLGLNIVKRYVDLMQGHIHFESRIGEGTSFYLSLPLGPLPGQLVEKNG